MFVRVFVWLPPPCVSVMRGSMPTTIASYIRNKMRRNERLPQFPFQ